MSQRAYILASGDLGTYNFHITYFLEWLLLLPTTKVIVTATVIATATAKRLSTHTSYHSSDFTPASLCQSYDVSDCESKSKARVSLSPFTSGTVLTIPSFY